MFNAVTLATGIEDVQKRFTELNKQMQDAELNKLKIFQALPEGFVPEFKQGALGNTEVTIRNVGMEDPRVKLKVQMAQEEARIQAEAAEAASKRNLSKQLELDVEKTKLDTLQKAGATVAGLSSQLAKTASPTKRQEILKTAIPVLAGYARDVGGAFRIPGLTQFIGQYQDDLAQAQQAQAPPRAQMPAEAGTAEGAPPSDMQRLLESPNGIKNLKIAKEQNLTGRLAEEQAAEMTLRENLEGMPEQAIRDRIEAVLHPERAAQEEKSRALQLRGQELGVAAAEREAAQAPLREEALQLDVEAARARLKDQTTDLEAGVNALKLQGVTDELGRQAMDEVASAVADDPDSAIKSVPVTIMNEKGKPEQHNVLVAKDLDLTGDAKGAASTADMIEAAIQSVQSKGVSRAVAEKAVRSGLKSTLQGVGGEKPMPGVVDSIKARLAQYQSLDDKGNPDIHGSVLSIQGVPRPDGTVGVMSKKPGSGGLAAESMVDTTSPEGLRNMAKLLNAATGSKIKTVRVVAPEGSPGLSDEAAKKLGATKMKNVYEIPVEPAGAGARKPAPGKPVGGGGSIGGISGATMMKAVMGAKANVDAIAAARSAVKAAVPKERQAKAEDAVTETEREVPNLTKAEKITLQNNWKNLRGIWKGQYEIKVDTLKDMNEALGLPRNDGLGDS